MRRSALINLRALAKKKIKNRTKLTPGYMRRSAYLTTLGHWHKK